MHAKELKPLAPYVRDRVLEGEIEGDGQLKKRCVIENRRYKAKVNTDGVKKVQF
jgi:hypothetical protein